MPVRVTIDGVGLEPVPGASLFECAESVGVRVPTSCVKQGNCRECMVEVEEGMALLTPRTSEEQHLSDRFRLACRARVVPEAGEIRCHTLRRGVLRIETASHHLVDRPHELDPAVSREQELVLLDGLPIAQAEGPLHGLAVDIGTTTVALRLYDLESGVLRATYSFENPQRFGGSDVMARIRFDGDHKGRLLQRTLIGYLTHAIESLGVDPRTIYEAVVAANTTMRELFFGLNVQSIGQMPYRSTVEEEYLAGARTTTSLAVTANRLRLPIHPKARVYGLPLSRATLAAMPPHAYSRPASAMPMTSRRSWTSERTRSSSSATGAAYWRRRARRVPPSRAARSAAACPRSRARSSASR
jgi:uncharacterized 2Fe-2S/4Fe-4S cluster protein (DUF4445 family)